MFRPKTAAFLLSLLFCLTAHGQTVYTVDPLVAGSGTKITILGDGFGSKKGKAYLAPTGAGKKLKLQITSWSNQVIEAKVPSKKSPAGGYELELKPKGTKKPTGTGQNVTVQAPKITKLNKDAACLGLLAIEGEGFSEKSKVRVGGKKAKVVSVAPIQAIGAPKQRIVFEVPNGKWNDFTSIQVRTGAGKTATSAGFTVKTKKAGKPHFKLTGGGLTYQSKVDAVCPAALINLGSSELRIECPLKGGDGAMTMSVPGFQACLETTYTVQGTPFLPIVAGGNLFASFLALEPGTSVAVTITHVGGGQIAGTLTGTMVKTEPDQENPPYLKKTTVSVSGSFIANVFDVEYTGS